MGTHAFMSRFIVTFALILLSFSTVQTDSAFAQALDKGQAVVGESGLTIPRFVSIDTDKVNMRTGPGDQYPILWVYQRNDLPLVVTSEYGQWRRVRDFEGTSGWMHRALLSGERTAIVTGSVIRNLYAEPNRGSEIVIKARPGVVAPILRCTKGWCQLNMAGREGWLPEGHIWGTFTSELIEE